MTRAFLNVQQFIGQHGLSVEESVGEVQTQELLMDMFRGRAEPSAVTDMSRLLGVKLGDIAKSTVIKEGTLRSLSADLSSIMPTTHVLTVGGEIAKVSNKQMLPASVVLAGLIARNDAGSLMVESGSIDKKKGLHLRIVSPDAWNFTVGDDPYYGSMILSHNYRTGLDIRVAVQRLACTNYQIGNTVGTMEFSVPNIAQYTSVLENAIAEILGGVNYMRDELNEMNGTTIAYPGKLLASMARNLKVPDEAYDNAVSYFGNEPNPTMYGVLQAITSGTHEFTSGNRANWRRRTEAETGAWNMSRTILDAVRSGEGAESVYLSGDDVFRHKVIEHIRTRAETVPEDKGLLLEEVATEISSIY